MNLSCFCLTQFLVYSQGSMRITFIINCALNAILSVTAVVENTFILWALTKCSASLRPHSKALLFSLALSDLAVGALVQPLYVMYKAAEINDNFGLFCIAGVGFHVHLSANVFSAVFFLTVTAIALDRLLVFHLQKRYNATISLRRATIALLLLWSSTSLWVVTWFENIRIYQVFNIAMVCVCLTICAPAYITLQIRLHKLQTVIASRLQIQGSDPKVTIAVHTPHLQLYRKSVTTMFYIFILLILCYAPYLTMFFVIQFTGSSQTRRSIHFFIVGEFKKSVTKF